MLSMKLKKFIFFAIAVAGLLCNSSCEDYLDVKSSQSLSTPETLDDLQALSDNFLRNTSPLFPNNMSDEYYIDYSLWAEFEFDKEYQDSYIWAPDFNPFSDWRDTYNKIFHYNTILDNLQKIDPSVDEVKWNAIKGASLFSRAFHHEKIAQLYAPQYDAETSDDDLGIPLRLTSNFNVASKRSTVEETYNQLIEDFSNASLLLPDVLPTTGVYKYRPTRLSCYAMLAKLYLQMGDFEKAYEFSDQFLDSYNYVLDFNDPSVDPTSSAPFPPYDENGELIYYIYSPGPLNSYTISYVNPELYDLYDDNDLRKSVYFEATVDENGNDAHYFKGPYTGTTGDLFTGIATDEIYLIRAEASVRLGDATGATDDLNYLLERRYLAGTFVPYSSLTTDQLLPIILEERKKELVNRGTRWADLRRLNKDSRFAVTIQRSLNGEVFSLPPNDLRYTLLIPREVMIKTNLSQNPR